MAPSFPPLPGPLVIPLVSGRRDLVGSARSLSRCRFLDLEKHGQGRQRLPRLSLGSQDNEMRVRRHVCNTRPISEAGRSKGEPETGSGREETVDGGEGGHVKSIAALSLPGRTRLLRDTPYRSSLNIGSACGLWMTSGAWKSNGMGCGKGGYTRGK